MDKYKLSKENKYFGQVDLSENNFIAKVFFKSNRIRFYSALLALELSFFVFSDISGINSRTARNETVNYMHDNFYYDVKEIGNELSRHKSKYRQLEDRYNEMSDDEKSDYVVLIFNNIIDNSDEFTDEEKEYLKEREGRLLKEYGHYYYFDSIFNMIYRLRRVKIERDVEMDSGIDGQYNNIKNLISISKGGDMDVLGHEVEHAITINYAEFNMLNEYGLTYMFEAIDSSTDLEYYDSYSYNSIMRNHMLFLSKVIGKDNLLRIYLNGDLKLLKK